VWIYYQHYDTWMTNSMAISLDRMENGAHRATFKVEGGHEGTVIGMTRMQALDKAFSEIRKIIQKTP
jgi:hypothetical protein